MLRQIVVAHTPVMSTTIQDSKMDSPDSEITKESENSSVQTHKTYSRTNRKVPKSKSCNSAKINAAPTQTKVSESSPRRSAKKRRIEEMDTKDTFTEQLPSSRVVLIPIDASDGWAVRWNELMDKHELQAAERLAEMLVDAYDACSCRIERENVATQMQGEGNILQEEKKENILHINTPGSPPRQNTALTEDSFTCLTCCKTFKTQSGLRMHVLSHSRKTAKSKPNNKTKNETKPAVDISETGGSKVDGPTTESYGIVVEKEVKDGENVMVIKRTEPQKDYATGEEIKQTVQEVIDIEEETKETPQKETGVKTKEKKVPIKKVKCFTCEYCGKEIRTAQLLKHHIRTHTGERPLLCKICGKRFIDSKALHVHNRVHNGSRPYSCTECNQTFTQASNLKRHMSSVHERNKGYLCQYCDARFARLEHLQNHEHSHLNVRPFTCEVCGAAFGARQQLQRHLAVHTQKRPFPCPHCTRTFNRKDRLTQHLAQHVVESRDAGDERFSTVPLLKGATCCIMKPEAEENDPAKEDTANASSTDAIIKSIHRAVQLPPTTITRVLKDGSKAQVVVSGHSNTGYAASVVQNTNTGMVQNQASNTFTSVNVKLPPNRMSVRDGVVANSSSLQSYEIIKTSSGINYGRLKAPVNVEEVVNGPSTIVYEELITPSSGADSSGVKNSLADCSIGQFPPSISYTFETETDLKQSNVMEGTVVSLASPNEDIVHLASTVADMGYVQYSDKQFFNTDKNDGNLHVNDDGDNYDSLVQSLVPQPQQEPQHQQQQQIIYYKNTDTGELVEILPADYETALENAVLYQVEVGEEGESILQQYRNEEEQQQHTNDELQLQQQQQQQHHHEEEECM